MPSSRNGASRFGYYIGAAFGAHIARVFQRKTTRARCHSQRWLAASHPEDNRQRCDEQRQHDGVTDFVSNHHPRTMSYLDGPGKIRKLAACIGGLCLTRSKVEKRQHRSAKDDGDEDGAENGICHGSADHVGHFRLQWAEGQLRLWTHERISGRAGWGGTMDRTA